MLFLFHTLTIITAERTKTTLSHVCRYKALTGSLVGDLGGTEGGGGSCRGREIFLEQVKKACIWCKFKPTLKVCFLVELICQNHQMTLQVEDGEDCVISPLPF